MNYERLISVIVLVAASLAFNQFDNDTLAATSLGGALALLVPSKVPQGAGVALGCFCGAMVSYGAA